MLIVGQVTPAKLGEALARRRAGQHPVEPAEPAPVDAARISGADTRSAGKIPAAAIPLETVGKRVIDCFQVPAIAQRARDVLKTEGADRLRAYLAFAEALGSKIDTD